MTNKVLLELKDISKIYNMGATEVKALDNASLSLRNGEFISITGPSGSGKSTLMHIMGLLDNPTTGRVFFEGRNVSKFSEAHLAQVRNKKIGFVFQQFNLLDKTSVLENVSLPLVYRGISKAERINLAEKVLVQVGLGDRFNHHPNQLSGGQQQRVAIARALVANPEIIFADEPTGNLDSKSGKEILDIFKKLNKEGRAIVLVTHEGYVASQARRTVKLRDGKIVK